MVCLSVQNCTHFLITVPVSENVTEHKMCVLSCSANLCMKFLILKNNPYRYYHTCTVCTVPGILCDFNIIIHVQYVQYRVFCVVLILSYMYIGQYVQYWVFCVILILSYMYIGQYVQYRVFCVVLILSYMYIVQYVQSRYFV